MCDDKNITHLHKPLSYWLDLMKFHGLWKRSWTFKKIRRRRGGLSLRLYVGMSGFYHRCRSVSISDAQSILVWSSLCWLDPVYTDWISSILVLSRLYWFDPVCAVRIQTILVYIRWIQSKLVESSLYRLIRWIFCWWIGCAHGDALKRQSKAHIVRGFGTLRCK